MRAALVTLLGTAMADTLQQLDQKFVETEQNYTTAKDSVAQLQTRLEKNGEVIQDLESDVRIEREWRERLQVYIASFYFTLGESKC